MPRRRTAHVGSGFCVESWENMTAGRPAGDQVLCRTPIVIFFVAIAILSGASRLRAAEGDDKFDAPNDSGVLRTVTVDGSPLDGQSLFFKSLGTNGRSCGTCHVPA